MLSPCRDRRESFSTIARILVEIYLQQNRRNKTRTIENLAGGDVDLTAEEVAEINNILEAYPVKGGRFVREAEDDAQTWG